MKRILYINCTVRNDSRTAGLCSDYLKELAGEDVEITELKLSEDTAWSAYFEKNNSDLDARENRRILYHAMLDAGFTNLPSEWWHYDYGTKFWGYFTGKQPLYEGLGDVLLGRGEKILTQ